MLLTMDASLQLPGFILLTEEGFRSFVVMLRFHSYCNLEFVPEDKFLFPQSFRSGTVVLIPSWFCPLQSI